jgi:hypothetical protein
MPIFVSDSVQEAIATAAKKLQVHYQPDQEYSIEDLQSALTVWLEMSLEQLADDALFHVAEGSAAYAFNRAAFELAMKSVHSKSSVH